MAGLTDRIRAFWNARPCGTTHVDVPPGTREYFLAFDRFFARFYPYLVPFLDLPSLAGKRVLEIGIGSGTTLQKVSEVAAFSCGVDLSEATLRLNARRRDHFGLPFRLVQASAVDLPFPDGTFDAVVTIGCLHHVPDIARAVTEIRRVLAPRGTLKGMVYHRDSWRYRVYIPVARRLHPRWRGRTVETCVNEMYDEAGNPFGAVFSRAQMRSLLGGFQEVRFRQENFVGSEAIPLIGDRIPRGWWLATLGRVAGLDLYFSARAAK